MKHRFIISVLIFSMLFMSFGVSAELYTDYFQSNEMCGESINTGDSTIIVELDSDVLDNGLLSLMEDADKEEVIREKQKEIFYSIQSETGNRAVLENQYTLLFNGFTIKADCADIEKIQSVDGVKQVYVCSDIKLEPHLAESIGAISALKEDIGTYTGKGQLVAIIDNEFDTGHSFFSVAPSCLKYNKSQMDSLISEKGISVDASMAYVSDKIPFAYNYASSNYDLYSSTISHGTHVAGIAVGSSAESGGVSGVAPGAQVALMRIADDSGAINQSHVIKAIEDAVKLGVCAINISIGADYTSTHLMPLFESCFDKVRSEGIFISVSAGNRSRGYYGNKILTSNIDYSSSGAVANFGTTFSVGSVNKPSSGNVAVSSFSAYGVDESLTLNPDISAPGAYIYSSLPGGAFGKSSGTSMASPHVLGAVAVMNEYMNEKMPEITGIQRLELIEKQLMSGAKPANYGTMVYSPRVQGAGVLNVASAINTPVVLKGDGNRSKISLGDKLDSVFSVKFTAENISGSDASYDDISLKLVTDNYTTSGGRYFISGTRALNFEHTFPLNVTIPSGETTEIEGSISLDESQLQALGNIFTNGFFIDGYVYLKTSDSSLPEISIPFTGFYGDWTKASVFDTTKYDEYGSSLNNSSVGGETLFYSSQNGKNKILGNNGSDVYRSEYVGISPNGDGNTDALKLQFTPMRTLAGLSLSILDKDKNLLKRTDFSGFHNKFNTRTLTIGSASSLDDGEYFARLGGVYNYNVASSAEQTLDIPFYVDTRKPEITNMVQSGDTISVSVKDNKHLSYLYAYYKDESGNALTKRVDFTDPGEAEEYMFSFSLSDISANSAAMEDVYIYAYDMAGNYYVNSLSCLDGDINPYVMSIDYTDNVFTLKLGFRLYKLVESCDMLLGFYDESNRLLHIEPARDISFSDTDDICTFSCSAELETAVNCRLYIWESMEGLKPVDEAKIFNIEGKF